MRRVVFLAMGTRGDVLPQVAMARALQVRGAEVKVVALPEYAHLAADAGVPFAPVGSSISNGTTSLPSWVQEAMPASTVVSIMALYHWCRREADAIAAAVDSQVRPGDLVVSGLLALDLASALRADRGCDVVHVTFSATVPTAYGEGYIVPPLPGRVSGLNRHFSARHAWPGSVRLSYYPGQALRRRLGLPTCTILAAAKQAAEHPVLIAASPVLVPPMPDWPTNVRSCGAWVIDEPVPGPADLDDFIAAGPAPAYVGFGSMLSPDPRADLRRYAEVARRTGIRLVVRANEYVTVSGVALPEDVYVVGSVSHEWLFPRMAAVVHHGGAGTTTAALRAGVPQGIVAHVMDQAHHGRRVAAVGVGPKHLRRRHLTDDGLAALLVSLTSGPHADAYRRRAREVAQEVRAEDGVGAGLAAMASWGYLPRPL